MSLIKPHGGTLINRMLNAREAGELKRAGLPRIAVIDDFILDIEKIAIGAYSPLKGFMCKDDFSSVVHDLRMADGTPWSIPIFLPVDKRTAGSFSRGESIIITDQRGKDIAILKINEIFSFPKDKWIKKVYSTRDRAHPGVDKIYSLHDKLMGGDIFLINRPRFKFEEYNLDPVETRQIMQERNWKTIAGFQTRNIPHRAHEYLQKVALNVCDGLLIHPLIGWKKGGDFTPDIIIKTYKTLIKHYYPNNSVILAGLTTAMRYAGPREAVFHAIIRKNYGCTHFIVGRDHAGVGNFYDKYEAHRIFDKIDNLGIQILALKGPYYCKKCKEVTTEKICPHKPSQHLQISGTLIRKLLFSGKDTPEYLLRPEVKKVALNYIRRNKNAAI